jgi:hypothetical protein
MTKNATYKNDLFSIASKELLQRVERFILAYNPLWIIVTHSFWQDKNSIATFFT